MEETEEVPVGFHVLITTKEHIPVENNNYNENKEESVEFVGMK